MNIPSLFFYSESSNRNLKSRNPNKIKEENQNEKPYSCLRNFAQSRNVESRNLYENPLITEAT